MSLILDFRIFVGPLSFCVFLLLVSGLCAQSPADSPAVTIRSNVRLVQIDVIAKDKHGNPVDGLDAKDFVLLDDGAPQKISRVTVENGSEQTASEATGERIAKSDQNIFSNTHPDSVVPTVILFDVLNTAAEDQPSMKKGLLQSLNHIKEGTPIALLILGDDLTVVSDFTTSTISLAKIAGNGLGLRSEGFGPPITARATGNPTRDRMIMKATTTAFRAEERDRVAHTIAALRLICGQLSRMRGRKSLLWISGGLSTSGESSDVQDAIDKFNDANVAVYTVDTRGVLLDPGITAGTDTNDLTIPVQTERDESRGDVLSVFATATGGVAYRNTNRIDGAVTQALSDRNLVYVLDYYPRHGEWNGKFHKLQLKTSRSGVRLRYRTSYRATLPSKPTPQEQQQMLAAIASSPLDYAGLHYNVQVEPGPPSDPRLILQIPADQVEWSSQEGKMLAQLEIWYIQKRATGDDITTKNAKANIQLSLDQYQTALGKGLSLSTDLELEASAEKIRVMVRDQSSGKVGSVDVPVDAKALSQHPN